MKTRTIALLAAATVLALARPSWAQVEGFRADRFEMAPSVEDGFVLQGPDTLGHLRWNANVTLGLAATTLRVTPDEDTSDGFDVVGTRFSTYLGFAIGLLDRFEVDLQIPVALAQASEGGMQGGFAVQEAGSTALGDIRVGGSALLVGKKAEGFQLGATAMMTLPTGSEDDFNGDGSVGGLLTANAGYRAPSFRVVANAGVRLRSQADFVTSNQGHELIARGGVLVPLLDQKLTASAELDAQLRTGGDDSFDNVGSPFLGLLAARYNIGSGWHAGAGAGFGLTLAPGSPRYRLLATVGYMPETKKTPPPPPGPVDTDKDGYYDPDDKCPLQPEDFDNFEDKDGCPEADNDNDKILDADDKCPRVDGETAEQTAEVYNQFEDTDGCPDQKELSLEQVVSLPAPIEFEYDKAILLPGSDVYLNQVLKVLQKQPKARLEVQGHTSSEGGREYNQRLSDERAAAVVKWLTDRGIAKGRLVARGYGLTKPLVDNDTEENRQKNRRVVFVLLNPEETTGGDASGAEGTTPAPSSEPVPAPGTPKTAPKGGKQ